MRQAHTGNAKHVSAAAARRRGRLWRVCAGVGAAVVGCAVTALGIDRPIRIDGRQARLYAQTAPLMNSGKAQPGSATAPPRYPKVTLYQVGIDFGPGQRLYVAMARLRETAQLVELLAASIHVGAAPVCGF